MAIILLLSACRLYTYRMLDSTSDICASATTVGADWERFTKGDYSNCFYYWRGNVQYLKDSGFRIVAATEKGDYDYTKADYTGPLCIIMGAEDTGVSVSYTHIDVYKRQVFDNVLL